MNSLAVGYRDAGKFDLALPLLEETLKLVKAKLGPDHPHTLHTMANLGVTYKDAGRLGEALPLLEEAGRASRKYPQMLWVDVQLGYAYIRAGHTAKAEPLLRECLAIRERTEPDAWTTFSTKSMLGAALLGQKDYAGAEPLLLAGYLGMKEREAKIPARRKICLIEALEWLVQLYEATGQKDKAKEWQQKLAEAKAPANPAAKP